MTKLKAKFELYSKLQALGFTYEEAVALRRIEMTLHRWAEAECNGEIEREEIGISAGKPFRVYEPPFMSDPRFPAVPAMRKKYLIADREAGALRRLKAIVFARNARARHVDPTLTKNPFLKTPEAGDVIPYHQTDPRGCALYLLKRSDLGDSPINQVYNRGVAVCA